MDHWRPFWRMAVFSSAAAAVAWILGAGAVISHMQARHLDAVRERVLSHAVFAASELKEALNEEAKNLQSACERLAFSEGMSLMVIGRDGEVLADSAVGRPENTVSTTVPEIQHAMGGEPGVDLRRTTPEAERHVYAAAPVFKDGAVIAVARISQAAPSGPTGALLGILGGGAVAAATVILALEWLVTRRSRREFQAVEEGVEVMGRGELTRRIRVRRDSAFAPLAQRLHDMGRELSARLRSAIQKRNQLERVLASMVEGVLAVDADERIILMNDAAGRLFGINPSGAQGRNLQEVVRNANLQRFFRQLQTLPPANEAPPALEGEITVYDGAGKRFLRVHGSLLRDGEGRTLGTLAALHDVTNMRKLESARRDFVANVSHELRTPMTSIKGYVETLLEDGPTDHAQVRSFLAIVAKQSDRLIALVEDLLALSRIEQEEEREGLSLAPGGMCDVLQGAYHTCQSAASDKDITITIRCEENLTLPMNQPLLQQAVTNLLDNAIKYSEAGTHVEMEALTANGSAVIRVRDQGRGIAPEHLDRIFERFYRVDKARSRQLGGTGLGLAIVKHIVQAHGGQAKVRSTPGQGSTFIIQLPIFREDEKERIG
ncbi:MAG: sensor histidine kinase [Candidatus Hydrogenedentota bacterium]